MLTRRFRTSSSLFCAAIRNRSSENPCPLAAQTRLPAQTEILESDPLEGDSSYMLRYGDWRKVDGVMLPFSCATN
jgi:hypothetical protein